MRVAFLTSRLRVEEKLLLEALERRRGVEVEHVRDDALGLFVGARPFEADVVLDRSLSFGRALYTLDALETAGYACVNRPGVVRTCGDKAMTSLALERASVPQPRTAWAFTPESAVAAAEAIGYPVVVKPIVGSWGRLVSRADDRTAAETIFEHRHELGSWQHKIHYIQEMVDKPGRDIRVFVIGDEPVAAIYRISEHWVTNTARGARVEVCPVEGPLGDLAVRAARAVGGGVLAVDVAETADGRLLVLEVNHSMEFRNSIEPTGVDIPSRVVDHVLAVGEQEQEQEAAA